MEHLRKYFQKHPVIAGIRDDQSLELALKSKTVALFILYGDIFALPKIMEKASEYDKLVFLHIDLVEGIGRDRKGVRYLAQNNLCDGIVTTKSNLIKAAKHEGLMAIQRLFLIDSAVLKTGEHLLEQNRPDAVEILPGIAAPYFVKHIRNKLATPIIAGGLIDERHEVEKLLEKGVLAVSSSKKELWEW